LTSAEIAEKIFKEGKYKALCRKITSNQTLAEELHSEFILQILEDGDRMLDEAKNFDFYCVGVIHNIWGKKDRYRITKGETSPLFQYSSTIDVKVKYNSEELDCSPEEYFSKPEPDYNIEFDYHIEKAKEIIKEDFFSSDINQLYKARTYYYSQPVEFIKNGQGESYKVSGNKKQYSKLSKISYGNVVMTCKRYAEELKKKIYE
jgi:hypothetical protein